MEHYEDTAMKSEETVRITLGLSGYEFRMLRYWAKIHGRPTSTYAAQIIGASIENSYQNIAAQMEIIATDEGISVDELKQKWNRESSD